MQALLKDEQACHLLVSNVGKPMKLNYQGAWGILHQIKPLNQGVFLKDALDPWVRHATDLVWLIECATEEFRQICTMPCYCHSIWFFTLVGFVATMAEEIDFKTYLTLGLSFLRTLKCFL